MKDTSSKLFWSQMLHSFMEWNVNLDWRFNPGAKSPLLHVLPTILISVFSTQLGIDGPPMRASNILWAEIWVSHYLEKILEARL